MYLSKLRVPPEGVLVNNWLLRDLGRTPLADWAGFENCEKSNGTLFNYGAILRQLCYEPVLYWAY